MEFPYIELAAKMGWDPYIVRRELRDLDKRSVPGFKLGVLVEFKDLSFHVHAPGDLSDEEMDEVQTGGLMPPLHVHDMHALLNYM